jgi:hypothetical protein
MIEAILCDLCLLHLDPQYDAVHLPLSNKVLRKASRYKSQVLGKTLPDPLNIMTAPEMDFMVLTKGHKTFRIIDQDLNVVPTEGLQSTLSPGPKLLSRIERFAVTQRILPGQMSRNRLCYGPQRQQAKRWQRLWNMQTPKKQTYSGQR